MPACVRCHNSNRATTRITISNCSGQQRTLPVCSECAVHQIDCPCGSRPLVGDSSPSFFHDGRQVCDHPERWLYSDVTGSYIPEDQAAQVNVGGRVVGYVHDSDRSLEDEGFTFEDGAWFLLGNSPILPHNYRLQVSPRPDEWSRQRGYFFGVELELELGRGRPRELAAQSILDACCVNGQQGEPLFIKHDGSLDNGLELVTQPISLPAQVLLWRDIIKSPRAPLAGCFSQGSSSSGLHVHVSRANLTREQVIRCMRFVDHSLNTPLILAVGRRAQQGRYASRNGDDTGRDNHHAQIYDLGREGGRYRSINTTGTDTIEFRIFKGTLALTGIIATLQFVDCLLQFTRANDSLLGRDLIAFAQASPTGEWNDMLNYIHRRQPALTAA